MRELATIPVLNLEWSWPIIVVFANVSSGLGKEN